MSANQSLASDGRQVFRGGAHLDKALKVSSGEERADDARVVVLNNGKNLQPVKRRDKSTVVLCHQFNLRHKGPGDSRAAADETYIRILDRWNYIGTESRVIHAYSISDARGARDALITLKETLRTVPKNTIANAALTNFGWMAAGEACGQPAERW